MDKVSKSIDGLAVRERPRPKPPRAIENERVKKLKSLGVTSYRYIAAGPKRKDALSPNRVAAINPEQRANPDVSAKTSAKPTEKSVAKVKPVTKSEVVTKTEKVAKPEKTKTKYSLKNLFSPNKIRILRYGMAAVLLAGAVFLAVDTWLVNRKNSSTADATSIVNDIEVSPSDIDDSSQDTEDTEANLASSTSGASGASQVGRITIPKIGVNARVLSMGLDGGGNIMAPSRISDAGWYNGSAQFGQNGAAFIDGHAGIGAPGVFAKLENLQTGDSITVENGDGAKWNYEVKDVKTIAVESVDMREALSVYSGHEYGLNLMTCAGNYSRSTDTYDHRVIVFAVLI